jgi:hypothetical protein
VGDAGRVRVAPEAGAGDLYAEADPALLEQGGVVAAGLLNEVPGVHHRPPQLDLPMRDAGDVDRVPDGRERVAQFVREHAKELVLAVVSLAELLVRLLRGLLAPLALREARALTRNRPLVWDGRSGCHSPGGRVG